MWLALRIKFELIEKREFHVPDTALDKNPGSQQLPGYKILE